MKLRDINIAKPPARGLRAKAPAIPMTGGTPDLTPKRPAWVRWMRAPNGVAVPLRMPGFLSATAPKGHVAEGSAEEADMKRELGL